MADVFSVKKRSAVTSRIRAKGNKDTEQVLAQLLRAERIVGWRRHVPLFGSPDFVFHAKRVAMFVDGCFWHCCPKRGRQPDTNGEYWNSKLLRNQQRDRRVTRKLRTAGWKVVRIWGARFAESISNSCLLSVTGLVTLQ
jgi:DNA mismatch endonuclease (patch repair protein)